MEKEYLVLLLLQCMVFILSCSFGRNNPLDEGGPNFIPPEITINEEASSFKNQDTIHFDSVSIVITGNREQSIFNIKVDNGNWMADWRTEGAFGFCCLTDGTHTIYINSMYRGGEMVVSDSVTFYVLTKGYKPECTASSDTTVALFEGKPLTLSVQAEGKKPFYYSWLKAASVLEGKNSDTLKITSFSVNDSASYKCIVTNEYGKDTSRTFILEYRPFSGGIKGVVTDSSGKNLKNVMVTLSPTDKKDTTDSTGSFAFTSLQGNSYTLQIRFINFHDTTLSNVTVNDSETVILPTIQIRMIDTTTYRVAYYGNGNDGGTIPSDTVKYKPGSKIAVAAIVDLSKTGHAFSKWNTKDDGSGDNLSPGDSFSVNDNVTFYAQWIVKQYNMSFNGNDNTSGDVPEQKKYDYQESVTLPDNGMLARAGYSFAQWNTKRDGTGKAYLINDTLIMPASDIELFARWAVLPTFKLIYNKNGADTGKVPVDSNSYYKGEEVTIAGNPGNLYRDGHSFSGWNTKADGTGETYNTGAKFAMPDSAVQLYVKWTPNPTYSIIYHRATSTGGDVPSTVTVDSGMQVTIADSGSLYKTGFTFVGWNTKEDGSGNAYKTGDKVVMGTLNVDLHAQWTKAQYTITYYGNGNTGGTVPLKTTHLYQTEIVIAVSGDLAKSGHSFVGWNTDSAGNGLDYKAGDKIVVEKNINLFARWIKMKYQITFSGNGERTSGIPPATEFVYGVKIDSSSFVSSRESYVFDGWFMDSLCTDKWKYELDSVTSIDTLYAKWVIKDVDGNIYTEVKIGNQVWMVENLKVTRYNDTTAIIHIADPSQWEYNYNGSYCYFDNDTAYKKLFGGLYDWQAVDKGKLAPVGWHVPTQDEIQQLLDYLIANGFNYDGTTTGNTVARSLAINSIDWELSDVSGSPGYDRTSNNMRTGLNILPGGYISGGDHFNNGEFREKGLRAMLWTSTEYQGSDVNQKNDAWFLDLASTKASADLILLYKKAGRSVRCIRNY